MHPDPIQPHLYYDNKFPGVSFLGKPLKYVVRSEQVTISPPNLGVTLDIPSGAVPPGQYITVTIRPCLSGSFRYPEGYEPLSAVYHISTDTHLKKKGKLTIEHFGDLQTKEQADNMTFFSAKSSPVKVDGKEVYQFGMVKGGEFQMGDKYGTISLQHFCFVAEGIRTFLAWTEEEAEDEVATEGTKQSCQIREPKHANNALLFIILSSISLGNRYIVLHSRALKMTNNAYATAIAVSVDEKVFIEVRNAVKPHLGDHPIISY